MLRELISLFRSSEPLKELGDNFASMLAQGLDLIRQGGEAYFRHSLEPEERTRLKKQDARINKLERRIRKQVLLHLCATDNRADLPYCLLLMSLVKDVERIGDYAKDLADLVTLAHQPLPEDEVVEQLSQIHSAVECDLQEAIEIFDSADSERAANLIRKGRATADQCEALIHNIARCNYPPDLTATLVLGARFYQRITGHVLNLLSSVVMPLHKLDYYKEDDLQKAAVKE